jgi:hypothetical protein
MLAWLLMSSATSTMAKLLDATGLQKFPAANAQALVQKEAAVCVLVTVCISVQMKYAQRSRRSTGFVSVYTDIGLKYHLRSVHFFIWVNDARLKPYEKNPGSKLSPFNGRACTCILDFYASWLFNYRRGVLNIHEVLQLNLGVLN